MTAIVLRHCVVEYADWGCVTYFQDGSSWGAKHHDAPDYYVISARCGYDRDLLRYAREHDVMHSLVAEHFHDAPCPILWAHAHGQPVDLSQAPFIECLVQALQGYVRANRRPIIGDVDWAHLRRRAIDLLGA